MTPNEQILQNLTRALAVVEAAPEELFNLNIFATPTKCGTLACSAGWLAVDPFFSKLREVDFKGSEDEVDKQYLTAQLLAESEDLFGPKCFANLFAQSGWGSKDRQIFAAYKGEGYIPDKYLAIERFKRRIKDFGP